VIERIPYPIFVWPEHFRILCHSPLIYFSILPSNIPLQHKTIYICLSDEWITELALVSFHLSNHWAHKIKIVKRQKQNTHLLKEHQPTNDNTIYNQAIQITSWIYHYLLQLIWFFYLHQCLASSRRRWAYHMCYYFMCLSYVLFVSCSTHIHLFSIHTL